MTWQFYLGLVLGLLAGGLIGFAVGRLLAVNARVAVAEEKIEAADAKADEGRDIIGDNLREKTNAAATMPAGDLKNALNTTFDDDPGAPPDLAVRDAATGGNGAGVDFGSIEPGKPAK